MFSPPYTWFLSSHDSTNCRSCSTVVFIEKNPHISGPTQLNSVVQGSTIYIDLYVCRYYMFVNTKYIYFHNAFGTLLISHKLLIVVPLEKWDC